MVVVMVVGIAVVVGLGIGALAWRLPIFDPAAPRASAVTIQESVEEHPQLAGILRSRLDSSTLTGLGLTVTLSLVIAGAIGAGVLLIMVNHSAGVARWDTSAARWGADHATGSSTRFLRAVVMLGVTKYMIATACVVAIVEWRRSQRRAVLGFMALVMFGQLLLVNAVKLVVDRPRPAILQLSRATGASFPSGHSATAAATWAAIALLLGRGRTQRTKAILAGGAAAIAVAVATSRVLLGVHWLTDVIAGVAVGWAWFAMSSIAFGGRVLSFGQPAKIAEHVADTVTDPVDSESSGSSSFSPATPGQSET